MFLWFRYLSMNCPFVLVLVLVLVLDLCSWFRGRERGRGREGLGSWHQLTSNLGRCSLSMNPEEHPTSNIQRRTSNGSAHPRSLRCSVFDVGRSMFSLGSGASTRTFSFREIPSPGKRAGVRADVTFLPRHRNVAKIVNRES